MAAIVALGAPARTAKIGELLSAKRLSEVTEVAEAATDDSVLIGQGRPIIVQMLEFAAGDSCDEQFCGQLCEMLLGIINRRGSRFAEEGVRVREILCDFYEGNGRLAEAVKALQTIPMEAGLRSSEDSYKVEVWVRIAENALQLDDEVLADSYISKAWPLLKNVKDPALRLRFSTKQAEVNDFKRKFIDAAFRFYELSHEDIQDHLPALRKASVCVLLADVSPRRARLLQTLYSDERMDQIPDLKQVISKVYHNRILRPKDVQLLQPHLLTHHKAITVNKRTVIENAIMQHNLLSASKLYYNISFNELGSLLGVTPDEAERVCAKLVAEDRIKASIDQVGERIIFASDAAAPILQWDTQISAACNGLATIADSIVQQHPQFAVHLSG
jgi:COP9 signalosome complex subunit 4